MGILSMVAWRRVESIPDSSDHRAPRHRLTQMMGKRLDDVINEFGLPDSIVPRTNFQVIWDGPEATVALTYSKFGQRAFLASDSTVVDVAPMKGPDIGDLGMEGFDPDPPDVKKPEVPVQVEISDVRDIMWGYAVLIVARHPGGEFGVVDTGGDADITNQLARAVGSGALSFLAADLDIRGVVITAERNSLLRKGRMADNITLNLIVGDTVNLSPNHKKSIDFRIRNLDEVAK